MLHRKSNQITKNQINAERIRLDISKYRIQIRINDLFGIGKAIEEIRKMITH